MLTLRIFSTSRPMRSNILWICRFRPWIRVTLYQGFCAIRSSWTDWNWATLPSSRMPEHSLATAASDAMPVTLTS